MSTARNTARDLEIIAEAHPQFGGDLGLLREMVRAAKANGADVLKVQLYDARTLLGEKWAYLELSRAQLERLRTWCDHERIELMASVFDRERLSWCRDLALPRLKIASRTVRDDRALCEAILAEGRETLVSLGFWTGPGLPFADAPNARWLYCKALYPTHWEDLGDFPRDFPAAGLAGYSDHTLGLDACLLAVARGAAVIEKHLTLDKTRTCETERAHVCSMTPPELAELRRVGGSLFRARSVIG